MGNSIEFGRMKIGKKVLQDPIIDLNILSKFNKSYTNKEIIVKALMNKDIHSLREISNYFYRTNGIYF